MLVREQREKSGERASRRVSVEERSRLLQVDPSNEFFFRSHCPLRSIACCFHATDLRPSTCPSRPLPVALALVHPFSRKADLSTHALIPPASPSTSAHSRCPHTLLHSPSLPHPSLSPPFDFLLERNDLRYLHTSHKRIHPPLLHQLFLRGLPSLADPKALDDSLPLNSSDQTGSASTPNSFDSPLLDLLLISCPFLIDHSSP